MITFDGSESAYDLKNLAIFVKQFGFRTFFTYAGKEDLRHSVFIDPNILANNLNALAAECEGFIIAWRRTSAHLFLQDQQFMNFMIENVRKSNPTCLIFGELYYGNTAEFHEKNNWGWGKNIPNCSSRSFN